jgi:hypothetical protein
MRCQKIEKWISDSFDRELPERISKKLERHLQKCSSCRSYRKSLEKIHAAAKNLDYGEVSPDYWEVFPSKIQARISSLEPKERKSRIILLGWRWAWVGAALILAIFIGLSILYFQTEPDQEAYVFSLEDSLEQIYGEIGDNPELAELFNLVILDSIAESLGDSERERVPGSSDLSLILEGLTEEELILLDSEIKKEIKS